MALPEFARLHDKGKLRIDTLKVLLLLAHNMRIVWSQQNNELLTGTAPLAAGAGAAAAEAAASDFFPFPDMSLNTMIQLQMKPLVRILRARSHCSGVMPLARAAATAALCERWPCRWRWGAMTPRVCVRVMGGEGCRGGENRISVREMDSLRRMVQFSARSGRGGFSRMGTDFLLFVTLSSL